MSLNKKGRRRKMIDSKKKLLAQNIVDIVLAQDGLHMFYTLFCSRNHNLSWAIQ